MLCMSLEARNFRYISVTSLWFQPRGCYFFHKEAYQSTFFQLIALLIQFIFQSCDEAFLAGFFLSKLFFPSKKRIMLKRKSLGKSWLKVKGTVKKQSELNRPAIFCWPRDNYGFEVFFLLL